ncbi:VirB4 family type IV secretion system protein [Deinococcus petrolearius]|uniref:VirB4 family type IV secretion system protein n=1 Tax=Deinococcus petrolearius TaxID=1751295 RepID=A0ABW1DP64_9DEIO
MTKRRRDLRRPSVWKDPETGGRTANVLQYQPYYDVVTDILAQPSGAMRRTDPGVMLLENGLTAVGVMLRPPPRLTMTQDVLDGRLKDLQRALAMSVPEGMTARVYVRKVQVSRERLNSLWRQGVSDNPLASYLYGERMKHLDDLRRRDVLREWIYFATLDVRSPMPFTSDAPPAPEALGKIVAHVRQKREEFIKNLAAVGYGARPMTADEIKRECDVYHNPDTRGAPHAPLILEGPARYANSPEVNGEPDHLTFSRQVFRTPINLEGHAHTVVGSTLVYALSLYGLPTFSEFGLFDEIATGLTEGDVTFVLEYHHLSYQLNREKLESAKRGVEGEKDSSGSAAARHRRLSRTLEHVYDNRDRFWMTGCTVLLYGRGEEQQAEMLTQVGSALSHFNTVRVVQHGFQSGKVYKALAPFNGGRTPFPTRLVGSNAIGYLPAIGPFEGVGSPTLVYRNRSDSLTVFDPYHLGTQAQHFLMLAPTGWGKTYLVMSVLFALIYHHNPRVSVIDQKPDLRDFILGMGGLHVILGADSPHRINPMDLPPGETAPDAGKLDFLIALYRAFVPPGQDSERTAAQNVLLTNAIRHVYHAATVSKRAPRLRQVRAMLGGMTTRFDGTPLTPDQMEMARAMSLIMTGFTGDDTDWGKVIDQYTNIEIGAQYVYYDLGKISPQSQQRRVAMLIAYDRVWHDARTQAGKKLLFIDELGVQLESEVDQKYFAETALLARSFGLSVGGATQSPLHLNKMPALKDAFQFHWLGRTNSETALRAMQGDLGMPEAVVKAVPSLQQLSAMYSEWVLVYQPSSGTHQGEILRIEESRAFYWLATSREDEAKRRTAAFTRYGGNTVAALEELVGAERNRESTRGGGVA